MITSVIPLLFCSLFMGFFVYLLALRFKESYIFQSKQNINDSNQHISVKLKYQMIENDLFVGFLARFHQDRYYLNYDLNDINWKFLSEKCQHFIVEYRNYLKTYVVLTGTLPNQFRLGPYVNHINQTNVLNHKVFFNN